MLVSKNYLTVGGSWMVKIVSFSVCNSIGLMGCFKDTFETSYNTSNMSAKIIIITSRLVRMIPSIELMGSDFPARRWLAYSLSSELPRISKSHLHWISLTSQLEPLEQPSTFSRERASV